jgi:cell wall integrity and stress response component
MTFSLLRAVALTAAFALLSAPAAAQTSVAPPSAITTLGCYDSADPLKEFGDARFQTSGYCQVNCTELAKPVMAIIGGTTCFCGDEIPPLDHEVDISKCDTICSGYGDQNCGGIGYWQVYLTGLTANVQTAPNDTSSSTANSSPTATSTQASVATKPAETVFVTNPASSAAAQKSSSGGPNKVGIAVGVVVGVIAIAAIIGGVVLFLRRRRNREIEEEHRRNAVTSSGKSDKSSNDQRLDPSIYSHRRESIGSIADERDFSRRILQV